MNALPAFVALPLAILCGAIILSDLKTMRIPDWISIALVGLFALWVTTGLYAPAMMPRMLVAGIVFVICFCLFAARLMGGGDTKVIPALALFAPPENLGPILLLFSGCLLVSIVFILALRRWHPFRDTSWHSLHSQKLPMGVAIGATALIAIAAS